MNDFTFGGIIVALTMAIAIVFVVGIKSNSTRPAMVEKHDGIYIYCNDTNGQIYCEQAYPND